MVNVPWDKKERTQTNHGGKQGESKGQGNKENREQGERTRSRRCSSLAKTKAFVIISSNFVSAVCYVTTALTPYSFLLGSGGGSSIVSSDGVRIQLRSKKQFPILNIFLASIVSIPCCVQDSTTGGLIMTYWISNQTRRASSNRVNLTTGCLEAPIRTIHVWRANTLRRLLDSRWPSSEEDEVASPDLSSELGKFTDRRLVSKHMNTEIRNPAIPNSMKLQHFHFNFHPSIIQQLSPNG